MKFLFYLIPLFLTLLSLTFCVNSSEGPTDKLTGLSELEKALGNQTEHLKTTIEPVKKSRANGTDALPQENIVKLKESVSKVSTLMKNKEQLSKLPFVRRAVPGLDKLSSMPNGDVSGFVPKMHSFTNLLGQVSKGVQEAKSK